MRPRWIAPALGAGLLLGASSSAQVPPGTVLVTSIATGEVYPLDPNATAPVVPIPVDTGGPFVSPRGLAVDRNGLLLVTDNGPKTLSRVDPSEDQRAIAAFFSALTSALRGIASASDGRVFVADPGIVPLVEPPLPAIRGITYLPTIRQVGVAGGIGFSSSVAGCIDRFLGTATCANLFLPTGVAVASEDPELVLLVADGGEPAPALPGRVHQGVIKVFPDRPFAPPIIPDPDNPPYPAVSGETGTVNDELFCAPGPFEVPRSLAIDRSPGREGTVLVTDSGDLTQNPPMGRVFRVLASGCNDGEPVELVAKGQGLVRPIGIAVADDDGTIFVADATADTVFRIDPDTDPQDLDGNGTGTVSPLPIDGRIEQAWALEIQRAHPGPYFVADATVPELFRVDPAAPLREPVTMAPNPNLVMAPQLLEVLPADAGLVVAGSVVDMMTEVPAVIEAELAGPQTVASQGGLLHQPTSVSREADGNYLVTDLGDPTALPPIPPAVIRIDAATGNQTLLSEGGKLVKPMAGAIDGSAFLIVADAGDGSLDNPPRIIRISPVEGLGDAGQLVLSPQPSMPPDPPVTLLPLSSPRALALDEGGGVILVADRGDATNPPSVLRLVRDAEWPGLIAFAVQLAVDAPLETPAGIAIDSDRSILVTDGGSAASPEDDGRVIRVDALSGLMSLVATDGPLKEPTGIGVRAPAPGTFPDQDGDGIADPEDNCLSVANTDQRDTDSDRIGNPCDPDYDNDGVVGNADFNALRRAFLSTENDPPPSAYDPDIDADGDGVIGNEEFTLLRGCFLTTPGRSGRLPLNPDVSYCKP